MQTKLIKLKRELEESGRKLRLIWNFRNEEGPFSQERFKPKSTFHPTNKHRGIETYPSSLEERFEIPSHIFNYPTKDGHQSLFD